MKLPRSKKLKLAAIALLSFSTSISWSQAPEKGFTEKLDGINTSSKQLLKDAGTDKSSVGQSGQMNTSVPLVTVSSRSLQFPLQLQYAAGIKVDQTSGPVGLGWVLPIGSIVRDYGAYEPDYSSTANEAEMLSWNGLGDQGWFDLATGTVVNPSSHNQYLGMDAIVIDGPRPMPISDFYHINVPGHLSNSFWNGGQINGAHNWQLTEMDNLKVNHSVNTYTISQEFSRINEANLNLTSGPLKSGYAAAIGVYPYVINGFAKSQTFTSDNPFNPQGDERLVRYEDFKTFTITDANGTVYVFGRALRGQKFVFNDDPYWSCNNAGSAAYPANGNFWKIDYIAEWLLTEIRSVDYVDSNNNGFADDGDAGDWIRFEYTEPTKTEQTVISGANPNPPYDRMTQEVPKHRTWSGFSQTDQASSLMREVAYLTKIVTPVQEIKFAISERFDVEHDYYTKPANRVGNSYYYEDREIFSSRTVTTDFDINYPVETMKYDSISVFSKLINQNIYPNEKAKIGTIVLNYAAKGSAQELAVSSYLIRNNNKEEKMAVGDNHLIGSPTYSAFNIEDYNDDDEDFPNKRGKTTLLSVDFYGSTISSTEKNSYSFEYAYNPSFDEIHKREIARAYFFPSLRQGSSSSVQPIPFDKAATPIGYNEKRLNTNGTSYTNYTYSGSNKISPYDFLIDIPYSELEYKLNTTDANKITYVNNNSTHEPSYGTTGIPITHYLAPLKDVYGYLYGSTQSSQAWSLTKITYPTGGQVSFEYEPGTFTVSGQWSIDEGELPIIEQYNKIAKQRSYVQDAYNVANAGGYNLIGLTPKRLTATFEISLPLTYGIRLKKKTINDRINPLVVTQYEYTNGQLTALPSEFIQSAYGAFNKFVQRQNYAHSIELQKYIVDLDADAIGNTGWTYDYDQKMRRLAHTGISLDDYSSTFFYSSIKTINADNSFTVTTYGPAEGTQVDYPEYDLFCYRLPSASWQASFTLAGDNINRLPISLLSQSSYVAGASTPFESTTYTYDFVESEENNSLSFDYDLGTGNGNFIELWNFGVDAYIPGTEGSVAVYTYQPINLDFYETLPFSDDGYYTYSYQRWGSYKLLTSQRTTSYKGLIAYTEYAYESGLNYMLREEKTHTQNEPNIYITRHKYAIEEYGPTSQFVTLNIFNAPYSTTSYLGSVANANTLSASVITYDFSLSTPKPLDTYVYETAVDPATGTFTLQALGTSSNWRISESDVYEYNKYGAPVTARSNQVYSKVVMGNNTTLPKAQFSAVDAKFDATYTGFEDINQRKLMDEWTSASYLDEEWFTNTNELSYASEAAVLTTSNMKKVCRNSTSFQMTNPTETWYNVITIDNTNQLAVGDEVDLIWDYQGTTYTFNTAVEAFYPETVLFSTAQAAAKPYVVCFTTLPTLQVANPNAFSNVSVKKHVKNYRLSSAYARTGKYSYKLPTVRTSGETAKKTPVRPVKLDAVSVPGSCASNQFISPECYYSYEASLWLRYDPDIPPIIPTNPSYTGTSLDTQADQLYRRGTTSASGTGTKIVCDIWNADRTQLLQQKVFYPNTLDASWKQYTVNLDIEKGTQKWLDVYVVNEISQVGTSFFNYKSVHVDDILVYPNGAKYNYSVADQRGNTTFSTDNNDVFVQSVYDAKGRVLNARNAYGKVVSEASYFDQPNWTSSQNYVTERAWTSTGNYSDTRYFMDGFGKTKQAMLSDVVRGTRMVSETNVYDNRGRVIQSWKPYVLTGAGLSQEYDAGYQSRITTFYNSNYPYSSVTYEATPMEKLSTATSPRLNTESAITASQSDYITTGPITAPSAIGGRVYNAATLIVHEKTDPMGKKVKSYLDNLGRVVMEEHEIGNDHVQNTNGSISVLTTGYATAKTWFEYDGAGRIISTVDPDDKRTQYIYNSLGLVVKTISPDKGTSEMRYDKYGQVRFVRNARDLEAIQNSAAGCDQFKFMKYDKWGRVTETGVLTTSPVAQNGSNPFPTTQYFDNYTYINDQAFPASNVPFVQIHTAAVYDGPRSEYKGNAALIQYTYSDHTLNTSTYLYTAGKTDIVSTLPMADGQPAKTTYQYDGLSGQHHVSVEYNDYRIPLRTKYVNGANSAYNFTWDTELDNLGRPKKTKTTHNNVTKQHSQNYYDALGNLMMVGVGSNGSGGFVDYHVMKMNIRNQVVSQMSNFVRIGLSYNANGNITSQTWSNQQLENQSGTNALNVNRYDYYYDNMNRLTGADYKQVTMGYNPFSYFGGLTSNVPSDFNCFVDESEVALALHPIFEEIDRNDLRLDANEVIDITNALSNLQAYYVSGNSAYGNMTSQEKNKFVDQYVEDAQLNRYTPEKLEMYFALWAEDSIYIDSLKNKDLLELSKKYTHWLLGTLPFDPPMQCASNPSSTVYGYLPDFVQPTFTSNANKYDMAYWYTKNGNITQLNRTDNAGIKTVQQYSYANSANNKLTGVTWTVGTNTPFTHNYSYDATGNLLTDPRNNVSAIAYSAYSDMPKQIVNSGGTINYRYFGGARSVKILSSTDREYYIAGMVLKQTGEVKSYQTANGYAVPNSNGTSVDYFYNVKDWLGTNRAVISATGQMVNALDVDPYGKKLPGRQVFSSNYEGYRYQFTGHEQDGETGYQYHGARYYAEELGRYMGVDPLASKFASWSTYNYAMSNPIVMVDPTGMAAEGWGGKYKDPSKGEAGGVIWTYEEGLNSSNYSGRYDTYMDFGRRGRYDTGDGYVGPVYLSGTGSVVKLGTNVQPEQVSVFETTQRTPEYLRPKRGEFNFETRSPWSRDMTPIQNYSSDWHYRLEKRASAAGYLDVIENLSILWEMVELGAYDFFSLFTSDHETAKGLSDGYLMGAQIILTEGAGVIPEGYFPGSSTVEGGYPMVNPNTLIRTENGRSWTKSTQRVAEIMNSAKTTGIIEPIDIYIYNGKSYILDGHHRVNAAIRLGQNVPVNYLSSPTRYSNTFELQYTAYRTSMSSFKVDGRMLNTLLK